MTETQPAESKTPCACVCVIYASLGEDGVDLIAFHGDGEGERESVSMRVKEGIELLQGGNGGEFGWK